jgi:hypothetical protein
MAGGTPAKLVSNTSMLPSQIEDQSGALSGQVDESLQQSIVDAVHLPPEGVRCMTAAESRFSRHAVFDSSFWRHCGASYFHAAIDHIIPGHVFEYKDADARVLRIKHFIKRC